MARSIKKDIIKNNLEGQIVWFEKRTFSSGGGTSVLGPYMKKPSAKKSLVFVQELEAYVLTKIIV